MLPSSNDCVFFGPAKTPRLTHHESKVNDLCDESMSDAREQLATDFSAYRQRLWQTVRIRMDPRLCGRVDPDDILQEAYMDAEKRLPHYVQQDSYSAFVWLRLIVGQTLINVHRRHFSAQKRNAAREINSSSGAGKSTYQCTATTESIVVQLTSGITSPSQRAIRKEDALELTKALDAMRTIDREVLILRHFEDLSNKEVAELLGIEPKAASVRYVRAIERLKKFMELP